MPRRFLSICTLFFAAGIAAGYFMCDKARPTEASWLAVSVLAVLWFAPCSNEGSDLAETSGSTRYKMVISAVFLCGMMLLLIRYSVYKTISAYDKKAGSIQGRVISAEVSDDSLKLVLKPKGTHGLKIMVIVPAYESTGDAFDLTGAVIEAGGTFEAFMPADDPGCFDYRLHMRGRSIGIAFRTYSFTVTDNRDNLLTAIQRQLYHEREDFLAHFDEKTGGFLRGVLFGDKSEIDEETVREFNGNSTGHILAVSGLHMSFLYAILRFMTGRKRNAWISLIIIAVILLYGGMTMWSAATVRACMVMGISLLSVQFRRPFDLLTAVSLAALLILIREPYQLFSSGFQMSFLAMLGIAMLTKPLSPVIGEALGVMLAVQLGTLPVVAGTFNRFNPLSILINVPVILITSLLVPLCIFMLMINMVTGYVPEAGERAVELITYALMKTDHFLYFDGDFSFLTGGPGRAVIIVFYIAVFGLSSEWARVRFLRHESAAVVRCGAILMLPVIMFGLCARDPFADDEIVFVAVGQGDCVHVRAEGHDILIDGGGSEYYDVGEKILLPYLLHSGAESTEIALVTHLHEDHYKGIAELSEEYPVGAFGVPADYRTGFEEAAEPPLDAGKTIFISPGSKISVTDDVYVEVIWPIAGQESPVSIDDPNEHNTVYMIHYNGVKVMVTGDLLEEDELLMTEYYQGTDTLECDVLKVAHHGSRSSTSEEFLDAASPSIAVIQAGRDNIYGHPHAQTLERLEERGISVFRTDINGAVGLDIKDGQICVDLFHPE